MKIPHLFFISLLVLLSCNTPKVQTTITPNLTYSKLDSCQLDKIEQLNIYFFTRSKDNIQICIDGKTKGLIEYLNNSGNEFHSAMSYPIIGIPDSIQIINSDKDIKITIPFNKEYDCIALDWRAKLDTIKYYKSCNTLYK